MPRNLCALCADYIPEGEKICKVCKAAELIARIERLEKSLAEVKQLLCEQCSYHGPSCAPDSFSENITE